MIAKGTNLLCPKSAKACSWKFQRTTNNSNLASIKIISDNIKVKKKKKVKEKRLTHPRLYKMDKNPDWNVFLNIFLNIKLKQKIKNNWNFLSITNPNKLKINDSKIRILIAWLCWSERGNRKVLKQLKRITYK